MISGTRGDTNTAKASLPKNGSNRDGTLNISTKELGNVVEMPTSSQCGEALLAEVISANIKNHEC